MCAYSRKVFCIICYAVFIRQVINRNIETDIHVQNRTEAYTKHYTYWQTEQVRPKALPVTQNASRKSSGGGQK